MYTELLGISNTRQSDMQCGILIAIYVVVGISHFKNEFLKVHFKCS